MSHQENPHLLAVLLWLARQGGKASFQNIATAGELLGHALWHTMSARRRYTTRTIADRLGLPEKAAKTIAHESFCHNARSFLEILLVPKFDFREEGKLLHIADPEHAHAIRHCERAVVATTAHIGPWELFSGLFSGFPADRPRMIIVRRQGNATLHALITHLRGLPGGEVVDHRNASGTILRGLRQQGAAGFLVDHNTSRHEAIFLPFLGRAAAVNMGPALLAIRAKALVWPIFLTRKQDGYVLHVEQPLDTATLEGDRGEKTEVVCRFYTEAVERIVREYPEQWFWMHKRWKTRPEQEDD